MKWQKRGLVFMPDGKDHWNKKYAMLPTPVHMPEKNVIRIFYASTDENLFGRISYLEVDDKDPAKIKYVHPTPILDIGEPGTFDDCGVNISSVVKIDEYKSLLYYVGYQRTFKTPYMLFMGSATLDESPLTASRNSNAPLIDRSKEYYVSHAAPFAIKDGSIFKMWFWIGRNWTSIQGKLYVSASIGYAESNNGLDWKIIKDDCIVPETNKEFSVGRPWVLKNNGRYRMFYSVRYVEKLYRIGYAESTDGVRWERKDHLAGIDVSETGWDSEMVCYPAIIETDWKTYMFYNGNNNGATGFGLAELIEK